MNTKELKILLKKWKMIKSSKKAEKFCTISCRIHKSKADAFKKIASNLNVRPYSLLQSWVNEITSGKKND
ncbi:MAG: hypothetical protein LBP70_01390 [Mycoplasmataceae bacterium]|nr:hypothetical protein [Mycoplasmataceae bacterium]